MAFLPVFCQHSTLPWILRNGGIPELKLDSRQCRFGVLIVTWCYQHWSSYNLEPETTSAHWLFQLDHSKMMAFGRVCVPAPKKIYKPKEYPNSNDIMGCFLRTGFVWVRHVNTSHNFDSRRRPGDKCKAQLAEPSKELSWSNSHLGDKCTE